MVLPTLDLRIGLAKKASGSTAAAGGRGSTRGTPAASAFWGSNPSSRTSAMCSSTSSYGRRESLKFHKVYIYVKTFLFNLLPFLQNFVNIYCIPYVRNDIVL
jgi:hypothetical protein